MTLWRWPLNESRIRELRLIVLNVRTLDSLALLPTLFSGHLTMLLYHLVPNLNCQYCWAKYTQHKEAQIPDIVLDKWMPTLYCPYIVFKFTPLNAGQQHFIGPLRSLNLRLCMRIRFIRYLIVLVIEFTALPFLKLKIPLTSTQTVVLIIVTAISRLPAKVVAVARSVVVSSSVHVFALAALPGATSSNVLASGIREFEPDAEHNNNAEHWYKRRSSRHCFKYDAERFIYKVFCLAVVCWLECELDSYGATNYHY